MSAKGEGARKGNGSSIRTYLARAAGREGKKTFKIVGAGWPTEREKGEFAGKKENPPNFGERVRVS